MDIEIRFSVEQSPLIFDKAANGSLWDLHGFTGRDERKFQDGQVTITVISRKSQDEYEKKSGGSILEIWITAAPQAELAQTSLIYIKLQKAARVKKNAAAWHVLNRITVAGSGAIAPPDIPFDSRSPSPHDAMSVNHAHRRV